MAGMYCTMSRHQKNKVRQGRHWDETEVLGNVRALFCQDLQDFTTYVQDHAGRTTCDSKFNLLNLHSDLTHHNDQGWRKRASWRREVFQLTAAAEAAPPPLGLLGPLGEGDDGETVGNLNVNAGMVSGFFTSTYFTAGGGGGGGRFDTVTPAAQATRPAMCHTTTAVHDAAVPP